MQTVDSFLVCPYNLGEKRQINLPYQNFKTRANRQRSLKGNKKPLRLKVTEFQGKVSSQENLVQAQRNENVPHASLITFHISIAEPLVQRPTSEIAMKA